ncbi:MAG TPA: hypothetical protein VFT42_06255 [Solirubrobacteraceae bacterium]|nr:hypothetical protein [Solirubrobacteraceae bacterium]
MQLPPGRFERWAERVVAAIRAEPAAELAGFLEPPARARRRRGPALALYAALDRLAFPAAGDPLGEAPRPAATALGLLGTVDVVLALAPAVARPLPLEPRADAWVVRSGGLAEMLAGESAVVTSLEQVAGDAGGAAVLAQAWTAVDPLSLNRTRASAVRKVPHLVRTALVRMARDGAAAHDAPATPAPASARARTLPGHLARAAAGVLLRRVQERVFDRRWHVLFRRRRSGGARGVPDPAAAGWRPLAAPRDRFWADPFVVERGGRHWLFMEEYSYRRGRAAIACVELTEQGPRGAPEVVFAPDHHVSYPFVFEHAGAMLMLPETLEAGGIRLYRARDFPRDWRLERVLVPDVRASDPTLVRHDGRLWLFAALQRPHERFADELCVWWADDLAGPWTPHPLNPVLCDVRSARPAGALFRSGDWLVRPGQDSSRGYGHAVSLKRVELLSEADYREREVGRVEPGAAKGMLAIHSLNADDAFEVIDANRRRLKRPRRRPAGVRARGGG